MGPEDRKGPEEVAADDIPSATGDDGVDISLIRWMLSLTPQERLEVLEQHLNSLLGLRHAKKGS